VTAFNSLVAAEHAASLGLRDQRTLFANLLALQWRGIGVPYAHTRVEFAHDLVEHRFAGLDGADVEDTGRGPLKLTVRIPFLNNIAPAPNETWSSGSLYPGVLRSFFAAMANGETGTLQHPEFGPIACKPAAFAVDWDAKTRDGVWADATFIETLDDTGQLSVNITGAGLVGMATAAGVDLDALLPTIPASQFPSLPTNSPSFGDFARGLQAVADQISLFQYSAAGQLNAIVFRVQNIESAITAAVGGASGADAASAVQYWPTRMAADTYVAALTAVKQNLLSSGKSIGVYVPNQDTSLPLLSQTIPAPVGDLIDLNPDLLFELVVPRSSRVRYYLPQPQLALTLP
jgi:prophage DNA circulation protein